MIWVRVGKFVEGMFLNKKEGFGVYVKSLVLDRRIGRLFILEE